MAVLRKSGFEDSFFFIVVVLTIAIFLLILSRAWNEMKDPLEDSIASSLPESDVNITKTFNLIGGTITLFDSLLPFILIGLFGFLFIGVAIYIQHPIMIVAGVIILGVAILLGVIYSNIYESISTSDEFSSTSSNLPISSIYMNYLPIIILLVFVVIVVAILYLKKGSGGVSI